MQGGGVTRLGNPRSQALSRSFRPTFNSLVKGSNPSRPTTSRSGRFRSGDSRVSMEQSGRHAKKRGVSGAAPVRYRTDRPWMTPRGRKSDHSVQRCRLLGVGHRPSCARRVGWSTRSSPRRAWDVGRRGVGGFHERPRQRGRPCAGACAAPRARATTSLAAQPMDRICLRRRDGGGRLPAGALNPATRTRRRCRHSWCRVARRGPLARTGHDFDTRLIAENQRRRRGPTISTFEGSRMAAFQRRVRTR